ncbi:MAG: single-stranded-DNA-specific exonuclease RecJ [Desulfopila sp.]|jgi:single-stranded-DNA-specific exonuclease|nr:single-stranded-DNA-specific exonuclease RecJ [Desulfopila sp.]
MKSITSKYWLLPPPFRPTSNEREIAAEFGVFPEIIRILSNRKITEKEDLRRFLYPTLHDLESPFLLKGMVESCRIISTALQEKQNIVIWGDYDVDGVTATALLIRFFKMLGKEVMWFVPNRFKDGYGLNTFQLEKLAAIINQPLLITVDCGITNKKEILYAKSLGYKIIVTDHHEPGEKTIQADAVINPKQQGCSFKAKDISGVGIAFYLSMGIRSYLKEAGYYSDNSVEPPNLKQLLDLVAIGTVADMVPLQGNNRVLVKAGFEVLNTTPSTGIKALLRECDVRSVKITAEDIAFQLAPKINAAGRLEEASLAVELLVENNEKAAAKLAGKLTLLNDKRKTLCRECLEYTLDISCKRLLKKDNCLVEVVPDSIGILGIVASQVCENFKVPVILVAESEDKELGRVLKGSCRSIPGVNIHKILTKCEKHLIHYGGHPMAAGITLYKKDFASFRECFIKESRPLAELIKPEPQRVDLEWNVERTLSPETTAQIYLLEPFGVGNRKPIFVDKNILLQDIKKMGKNGTHLSFNKRGKFENTQCVAFRFGEYEQHLKGSPTFNLLYSIAVSRYKNSEKWQVHLVDLLNT